MNSGYPLVAYTNDCTSLLADGFTHIKGYFADIMLQRVEQAIESLFMLQFSKIGDYDAETVLPDIGSVIEQMEQGNDKEALYQVQKMLSSSQRVRSLFNDEFITLMASCLGCSPTQVLLEGPGLFVSRPNDMRLKYKWHSEAHYYPKRRRFLNIWMPIFTDRTLADGAMTVLPGSHKEHWDFAEYQGYDKDTEGKRNHFVQYEIPEPWLAGYARHHCESKRGDLILFDRNTVHTSNRNQTNRYSYAIVARAWTPKDDLTLAGSMAATPYGGDIGRANLVVQR